MAASMSDDARRGYTMLARLFLIVGGAFAVLALLQLVGVIHLFNGDPLGVALLVLIIGVLLEWTVRTAPPPAPAPGDAVGDDAVGDDALGGDAVEDDALGGDPVAEDARAEGTADAGARDDTERGRRGLG